MPSADRTAAERGSRILLLGGSGMLGRALLAELGSRSAPGLAPSRAELDLARTDAIHGTIERLRPSAVINAAAYTDVAGAERPEALEQLLRLNRDAPAAIARACRALGLPLVQISTDYVFDGQKRAPYVEQDAVAPLQAYGRSKLAGEREVSRAHPDALIVRTSTLFGAGRGQRPHYVDAVLAQARAGRGLSLVREPVSSPTHAPDLARALFSLLAAGATGIVHVANAGGCTRVALALEALRLTGLAGRVTVEERSAPQTTPRRPSYAVLDTRRYAALTGRPMRPWQEALADYLRGGAGG